MASVPQTTPSITEVVQQKWYWFLILGVILVIGGMVAISLPLATSIAVALIIAAVLVVGGAFQIWQAFSVKGWGGFLWQFVTGLIAIIGGVAIYTNPMVGTLALTLVIAAVFIAQGVSQLLLGMRLKPHDGWGWVVASGVISIIAGGCIWFEFPSSAVWALGLLTGISIAFNGWSYIAIALAARSARRSAN